MKLISWNVNGLRACVKKGFEDFFKEADADIFCVQETKLQEGQIDFAPEDLLGGCLDCLSILCGTKFDQVEQFNEKYKEDGILWFLESCDLNPMGIRRALWQLDEAGWLKYTKGFLIGRPYCYGEDFFGMDQYMAVLGILSKYNVPVIMDVDIGHLPPMMPLVCGSKAKVKVEGNSIKIDMAYI